MGFFRMVRKKNNNPNLPHWLRSTHSSSVCISALYVPSGTWEEYLEHGESHVLLRTTGGDGSKKVVQIERYGFLHVELKIFHSLSSSSIVLHSRIIHN